MGALYGVLGSKGVVTVTAKNVRNVIAVWIVFMFCPGYACYVPVLNEQSPAQVTHRLHMTCGRCVDVCSEDVLQ